jgi:lipid-A-disaccharide synthase
MASALGVPVFYYIPPQVWAHGQYRLKKLRKWTTRVGLIHPFERGLYERYGVEAEYVGHPLFDEIAARPPAEEVVKSLRERLGVRLVGIFPGSRAHEIRAHMPIIIASRLAIRQEVPDVTFAAVSTAEMRDVLAELIAKGGGGIELLQDVRPTELARAAALCITKSGTITLEIASQGTPMVIFYRVGPVGRFLVHGMTHTPYIGLINTLAGGMVCPERLMLRDDAGWLAEQALRLLTEPAASGFCRAAIGTALNGFTQPGASARAARSALSIMDSGLHV